MSRSRNIKPGFFDNETLVSLPMEFRMLFIGLWTVADREGRFEDRPTRIKMKLFPADAVDVNAGLQALHDNGFILRYELRGSEFCQILAWHKHQNPHFRERSSVIPPPESPRLLVDKDDKKPEASTGLLIDKMTSDGGKARLIPDSPIPDSPIPEVKARAVVVSVETPTSRFGEFWAIYPVKKGKAEAEAKWKARKLDAIADKIIADVAKRQTDDQDWVDSYIPHGSTYVNGKGWEDGMKPLRVAFVAVTSPSKTMQALHALEGLKHAPALDRPRDQYRLSETDPSKP